MEHIGRIAQGHKPEERPDGRKTGISATGAITPFAFDMSEEVANQFSIYIFDPEFGRSPPDVFAGEAQK
jgi:hypothetical protein